MGQAQNPMFPVHAQTVKLSCLNVFTLSMKVEQKQAKNKNKTNKPPRAAQTTTTRS